MNIKCPHCGSVYDAEDDEYGRFVKCCVCGRGFVVGTSFTKKIGEAADAVKDAAKIVANVVCEKARNIDWKAKGERDKAAVGITAGNTYNKCKRLCASMLEKFGSSEFLVVENVACLRLFRNSGVRHKMARLWKLLAAAPWAIQFSSMYIGVFALVLAVGNLATAEPPSSFVQSLVIFAIAAALCFSLVQLNFVRWLLIVWGGFNVILLFFGSRDFAFLWPFNISFIGIAILLVTPSARKWYGIRNRVPDFIASPISSHRVYACAAVLALVMGLFLCAGYSSARGRVREARDNDYAHRERNSPVPTPSFETSSSFSSPANAKDAIRGALANVKERYRQNLRRFGLVESLYVDRKDLCQLILVEPIGDTPLYTIRYWKKSETLEWTRIMSKEVAEQFLHDRMLMDAYEKVLPSDK